MFACCHARSGCSACSSSRVRFITLREREGCRAFSYSVCGSGKAAFYIVPECQPRHVADTRSFSALLSNDSLLYTFLYSFFALHHKLSHSPKPQASPTVGCMSCTCTTTSTHFSSPAQRQGPLAQCTIICTHKDLIASLMMKNTMHTIARPAMAELAVHTLQQHSPLSKLSFFFFHISLSVSLSLSLYIYI